MQQMSRFIGLTRLPFAPILMPILDWLPQYDRGDFPMDFAAGCTVFVFLVPQGMAYAIIAGMPPIYGLYSATVPMFIYAILGTSKELSVGPMAITSLLLGVSCQRYGYAEGSPDYILLATNISMIVGLILFLVGVCKLGALTNLISQSVLTGFLSASALVIAINQMKDILGIIMPRFQYTHETVYYLVSHLNETNYCALLLGLTSFAFLYAIKTVKKSNRFLGMEIKLDSCHWLIRYFVIGAMNSSNLLVIVIGALITRALIRSGFNLRIIGTVPSGFMPPSFEMLSFTQVLELIPTSLAIAFVSFAGNWAIVKKYAAVNHYSVDATQELIAYGFSNIIGVVFNSIVVSGGLARTAVNAESGARTQVAGCITGLLILGSILLLTSFFYYVPMAVLAAVIEVSVVSMIDLNEMVVAYRIKKFKDCFIMVATFFVTLFVGVTDGLFVGIFLSVTLAFHSIAFPTIVHLGRLSDAEGGQYRNVERFPHAEQLPGIAIVRMDATLSFANCEYFEKVVFEALEGKYHSSPDVPIRKVILDVSAWIDIDLPAVRTLFSLQSNLRLRNVTLALACAKGKLRDHLRSCNFVEVLQEENLCLSIDDAVRSILSARSCGNLNEVSPMTRDCIDSGYHSTSADESDTKEVSMVPNPMLSSRSTTTLFKGSTSSRNQQRFFAL